MGLNFRDKEIQLRHPKSGKYSIRVGRRVVVLVRNKRSNLYKKMKSMEAAWQTVNKKITIEWLRRLFNLYLKKLLGNILHSICL